MNLVFTRFVRKRRQVLGLFLVGALFMGLTAGLPAKADDYRIGPQDRLRIEVVEWRPTTASLFEWGPLTGEFTISTSGNLSMPILGTLPVAGKTVEQTADMISGRLQEVVGLQKRPSASVEIAAYRPFFVGGLVANPGKYDYFPDLTVLKAISIAGGYARPVDRDALGIQREVLSGRGNLRELQAERLALLARNARLEAVIQDRKEISFPEEISAQAENPDMRQLVEDEEKIFAATQQAMEAEIVALRRSKDYAANQTDVLKSKGSALEDQAALANEELGKISGLVSKGLSASSRQFGAEQFLSELQTRQLDVAMALISTQQSVAQAEYKIADVKEKYRLEAQVQQTQVRDRITAIAEKIQTAKALLENIEIYAPQASAVANLDTDFSLDILIIRDVDGDTERTSVDELSPVLPGDIVQVERRNN